MDPVGAPALSCDPTPTTHQRQSILGSFLRVRPRGSSQSHQASPLDHQQQQQQSQPEPIVVDMPNQPPSPGPAAMSGASGHRRRPAAGQLQPSQSHGFSTPAATANPSAVHTLSHMLRRRRSANGALNSVPAAVPMAGVVPAPEPAPQPQPQLAARPPTTQVPTPSVLSSAPSRAHRIRLVPHLDSNRSLHFEPILRDVKEGDVALRIGRFTDRSGLSVAALNAQNTNKLAFKSKVVSRAHAEVWCEAGGKFFIKDTRSSSGTFLNHIRLSAPNTESRPFPLKDGDVLQLGVDYQGGTEEIYKCVKMRIELGREWQAQANAFNTNAMKQLKALSSQPSGKTPTKSGVARSGLSDCCICLFCVSVHQSLFIAPCSHVFHYKCIRPMLLQHHPGFSCPLCRTFANLEEDVEVDNDGDVDVEGDMDSSDDNVDGAGEGTGGSGEGDPNPNPRDRDLPEVIQVDSGTAALAPLRAVIPVDFDGANSGGALAAGAETEVERDFMPAFRRVSAGTTLRNNMTLSNTSSSTNQRRPPARVQEEADADAEAYGAMMAETEAEEAYRAHLVREEMEERANARMEGEGEDDHPLPPLPVPNSGMYRARGGLGGLNGGGLGGGGGGEQGYAIMRPMSVPVHALQGSSIGMGMGLSPPIGNGMGLGLAGRPMVVEDYSDNEGAEGGFEGGGGGEGAREGSTSSGEGGIGAGGKRKR